jgi:hypothetical protein
MADTALTDSAADQIGVAPLVPLPGAGGRRAAKAAVPSFNDVAAAGDVAAQQRAAINAKVDAAAAEKEGAEKKIGEQIASTAAPEKTGTVALPDKPQHGGMSQEEMTQNLSTLFAFAAIGGAMTRTPMTAALNAFSAGLKGMYDGDQAAFKRESEIFKQKMDLAIATNNNAHQEYQDAWEKYKNNISVLKEQLGLIATKYNDTVAKAAIDKGDINAVLQHKTNLAQMAEQASEARARIAQAAQAHHDMMELKKAQMAATQGAGGQPSQRYQSDPKYKASVDFWAKSVANGGTLPARFSQVAGKQFSQDVYAAIPLQGGNANDMLANRVNVKEINSEAVKLGTQSASVAIANQEMQQFIPQAEKAIENVPRTDFKPINELIQLGEKQWSPEQKQLVVANRALQTAYAQLVARGAPTVHSSEEAERILNTADSPEVYKAGLQQLQLEGEGAERGLKEAHDALLKRVKEVGQSADQGGAAPGPYSDPEKERRYQEWKAKNGG